MQKKWVFPHKSKIKDKSNLIIVFTSLNHHFYYTNNNEFELEKTFEQLSLKNCDYLFLKDQHPLCWYIADTDKILKIIEKYAKNYDKVLLTGISAGGYAAILYGSIIRSKLVIAVNPQTLLDVSLEKIVEFDKIRNIVRKDPTKSKLLNLNNVINNTTHYYANGRCYQSDCQCGFNCNRVIDSEMDFARYFFHSIEQYNNIKPNHNVFWCNFMSYKSINFINLLTKYEFN